VSLLPFPMRARSVKGSYMSSPRFSWFIRDRPARRRQSDQGRGSIPELAELIPLAQRSGLPAAPTTTRPLHDINEVIADLSGGKVSGRVVLAP
jgi:hypothetical protein